MWHLIQLQILELQGGEDTGINIPKWMSYDINKLTDCCDKVGEYS